MNENLISQNLLKLELPNCIPSLSLEEKRTLADDLRQTIIQVIAKTGGHLAPSLGVVELTIALLSSFDFQKDRIVWDVGHQTYAWKLLTGRAKDFGSIRQLGGLAAFPKITESSYDHFGTGHASTSISAALGMAMAREFNETDEHVIAVIGDGALTGGMALAALNQAGGLGKRLIVILNDNDMSISENVGALSLFLSKNLSRKSAMRVKYATAKRLKSFSKIGSAVLRTLQKAEKSFKSFFTYGSLFEAIGFNYIGPVDGHDIQQLEHIFNTAKHIQEPVLIHVKTQKGRGYAPAENNPSRFHRTLGFELETGLVPPPPASNDPSGPGFSKVFGETLCELATKDPRIVAISAAMPDGVGLAEFRKKFPTRLIDVGICEDHAVTFAAGLASQGLKPVVAIYASFMQRAVDQVIHDVCMQNLPVVFCLDKAGLVGGDGPTHHGLFDMSLFRCIPNLSILVPRDEEVLRDAIYTAFEMNSPVVMRYPAIPTRFHPSPSKEMQIIPLAKGEMLIDALGQWDDDITSDRDNKSSENNKSSKSNKKNSENMDSLNKNAKRKKVCVIGIGHRFHPSREAINLLSKKSDALISLYDPRWLKPLPEQELCLLAKNYDGLFIVEENVLHGGFSSAIIECLSDNNVIQHTKILRKTLPDSFVEQGLVQEVRKKLGLTVQELANSLELFIESL